MIDYDKALLRRRAGTCTALSLGPGSRTQVYRGEFLWGSVRLSLGRVKVEEVTKTRKRDGERAVGGRKSEVKEMKNGERG